MIRWIRCLTLALASFAPLPCAPAAEAPLGIAVDGPPFRGQLVGADAAPPCQLHFAGAETAREIPAAELVAWGGFVEPVPGVHILLAGGGLVVADSPRLDDEYLQAATGLFGKLRLPLKSVAGILFRRPVDRTRGDQLAARVRALVGQTDRVLLDNGDELTGTISGLDETTLVLQTDVGKLDIETEKLAAVIFNPILVDQPKLTGLRMQLGFGDGSRAVVLSLSADKDKAHAHLAGGLELTVATDSIVALQPLGGQVVYLSDLKPASYRHIPFLELSWPFQADHSVQGALLRAGGRLYLKGLGMHSPARVTYDLDGPYRRFEAEGAIDAEAGRRGSVVFRVFTDQGDGSWQERAQSETVRGGQPPVPISVDLAGARRISLLVDFADRGDELDHADWLHARLVR